MFHQALALLGDLIDELVKPFSTPSKWWLLAGL